MPKKNTPQSSASDFKILTLSEVMAHTFPIVESMHDACMIMDHDLRYLYVNTQATKFANKKKNEMIGKTITDIFPGAEKTSMYKRVLEAIRTQKKVYFEEKSVMLPKWLAVSLFPDKESLTVYISDITERKESEIVLKKNEERYKAFIAQATEGIWRFELERPISVSWSIKKQLEYVFTYGYLAEANDAMAHMYGLKHAKQIIGARLADLMPKTKENIDYLTAFIKHGYKLTEGESKEIDSSGKTKYFLNNLVGIIENNSVTRAWGTQRDITNQKKIQTEIQAILSSLTSHIAVLDKDGNIKAVNEAWNTFAHQNGVLEIDKVGVGENYVSVLKKADKDSDAQHILKGILSVLNHEIDTFTYEYPCHSATKRRWFLLQVTPLRSEGGGAVVAHTNITDRILLEHQKDEFLGIASHELKTPVTSIKAYAQFLQQKFYKSGDISAAQLLQKMDVQINKLTELISDLLDVTKIESGKLILTKKLYDFNELVREVAEEIQMTANHHTINLHLARSKTMLGDRDRTGQVITNFLTNAIKYSPHAKEVIIQTEVKNNQVTLCVQDYGLGIPNDKKDKVFERFFRVHDARTDTYGGLGLGLYISAEIIRRQKGEIWVESKEGKGSSFCFSLPIR